MTVNFRTHYRRRQDARDLPRLEELVDLELGAPATPAPKRARINRDPDDVDVPNVPKKPRP